MNKKNYKLTRNDWELITEYDCGVVAKSILEKDTGTISFCLRNEMVYRVDVTEHVFPEWVFLSQFGISVTEDGRYFFIQRWESGLYCFELSTGKFIWKSKRRHPYELVVNHDVVICRFLDQCVDVFSIKTGELLGHYPLGYGTGFWPLNDEYYFVGPKRGKYYIIDRSMNTCIQVPEDKINLEESRLCILDRVDFCENGIVISGVETVSRSASEYRTDWHMNEDRNRNVRVVQLNLDKIAPDR